MKVIVFTAAWCGPCKVQKKTIEEVRGLFPNIDFEILDVDNCDEELLKTHIIRSVPTTLIFRDNDTVERLLGITSKDSLIEKLNS